MLSKCAARRAQSGPLPPPALASEVGTGALVTVEGPATPMSISLGFVFGLTVLVELDPDFSVDVDFDFASDGDDASPAGTLSTRTNTKPDLRWRYGNARTAAGSSAWRMRLHTLLIVRASASVSLSLFSPPPLLPSTPLLLPPNRLPSSPAVLSFSSSKFKSPPLPPSPSFLKLLGSPRVLSASAATSCRHTRAIPSASAGVARRTVKRLPGGCAMNPELELALALFAWLAYCSFAVEACACPDPDPSPDFAEDTEGVGSDRTCVTDAVVPLEVGF